MIPKDWNYLQDYGLDPMFSCDQEIEIVHFFLHFPNHHCARKTLFHKLNQVSGTISRHGDSTITRILLFGDNKLDFETNKNFTEVYNQVYFISTEIQLSLVRVKLNDSIASGYS